MSFMEQELTMNLSANGDSERNSSFIFYGSGMSLAAEILSRLSQIVSILTISIYCFATVANTMIISVLFKSGFKLTTNICFFVLAIVDLLISITRIFWELQFHRIYNYYTLYIIQWLYFFALTPCGEAIHSVGSWIIVIVTMERLCCIMFPLKVKLFFTRTSVVCLIMAGFAYEIITMAVYFYGCVIMQRAWNEFLQRNRTLSPVWEAEASYDYGLYVRACALMAAALGPNYVLYTVIIIGTIVLVIAFTRSMQARKSLVAKQSTKTLSTKEIRLVQSVVAVCVIYIVSCTPLNIFETNARIGVMAWDGPFFALFARFARSFNHAMNIFAYLTINSNFRAHFKSLFCFCCTDKISA